MTKASSNEGYQVGTDDPKVAAACLDAVKQMASAAGRIGAKSLVILHWTQTELKQAAATPGWRPEGHLEIEAAAREIGTPVVDLYAQESASAAAIYRDDIHLGVAGHQLIAKAIVERMP